MKLRIIEDPLQGFPWVLQEKRWFFWVSIKSFEFLEDARKFAHKWQRRSVLEVSP